MEALMIVMTTWYFVHAGYSPLIGLVALGVVTAGVGAVIFATRIWKARRGPIL